MIMLKTSIYRFSMEKLFIYMHMFLFKIYRKTEAELLEIIIYDRIGSKITFILEKVIPKRF